MHTNKNFLSRSFNILHSVLGLVLIAYFLDFLYDALIAQGAGPMVLLVLVPVKIFLYSGAFGALAEIVGGQEIVFKFSRLKVNAQKYWKIYLVLMLLPFLIHFLLTLFVPEGKGIPVSVVTIQFNLVVLYLLVRMMISNAYVRTLNLEKRRVMIPLNGIMTIFVLYMADMFLSYLPQFFTGEAYYLQNIAGLLSRYIQFLIFLYLAEIILNGYPEIRQRFNSEKEIYLVNPIGSGSLGSIAYSVNRSYPPFFIVLKALTPRHYSVREFNQAVWSERYYRGGCLVAITCYTSNSGEAYRIAKGFKSRGATVVMGGPHVSYLPEEALEYCDSVVVGEAEGVWKEVIKDYECNDLKKKYTGLPSGENHDLIYQALLNSPPEVIKEYLETSRGCKFKCHFCTIPGISGGKIRNKPVFELVELIKKIKYKYKKINFIDNNIYNDPAYAKALFKALKPLNVKWQTACTIDIARNGETLKLARESGCFGLLFGYEVSEKTQGKELGGKFSMAEKYREYTKRVQAMGIKIRANFMFGFETDNFKGLVHLWVYCLSLRPFSSGLSLVTPLPGSKFYYDMIKENRLTTLNWRNYTMLKPVFRHKTMHHKVLSAFFPFLSVAYLLTTSQTGILILLVLVHAAFLARIFGL